MEESKYVIKNELELYIHVAITEKCIEVSKNLSFSSEGAWCEYIRGYIISGNKSAIEKIIFELDTVYVRLGNFFALDISEATSFILIYFKNRLWLDYLPAVKADISYFGSHFRMNNT